MSPSLAPAKTAAALDRLTSPPINAPDPSAPYRNNRNVRHGAIDSDNNLVRTFSSSPPAFFVLLLLLFLEEYFLVVIGFQLLLDFSTMMLVEVVGDKCKRPRVDGGANAVAENAKITRRVTPPKSKLYFIMVH